MIMKKKVKAPFIPKLSSETDVRNFDKMFTGQNPSETPGSASTDQQLEKIPGFTYNPNGL